MLCYCISMSSRAVVAALAPKLHPSTKLHRPTAQPCVSMFREGVAVLVNSGHSSVMGSKPQFGINYQPRHDSNGVTRFTWRVCNNTAVASSYNIELTGRRTSGEVCWQHAAV